MKNKLQELEELEAAGISRSNICQAMGLRDIELSELKRRRRMQLTSQQRDRLYFLLEEHRKITNSLSVISPSFVVTVTENDDIVEEIEIPATIANRVLVDRKEAIENELKTLGIEV